MKWEIKKLKELGTIIGGGTPSTSHPEYYTSNGIAWITPKDLSGYKSRFISHGKRDITLEGLKNSSARIMPKGTVLFSSRAPIGYVVIASNELCTNQGFKSVIPNAGTDPDFLYYLLRLNASNIEAIAGGSTFKEVSGTALGEFSVKVPASIDDQKAISSILSALDSKIENNNKINDNLSIYSSIELTSISPDISFGNNESRKFDSFRSSSSRKRIFSNIGFTRLSKLASCLS